MDFFEEPFRKVAQLLIQVGRLSMQMKVSELQMDFLRDLGGLFGAISPIFGFIVSVFQYRGPYMSLAAKMMPIDEEDTEPDKTKKYTKTSTIRTSMRKQL